MPGSNSSVSINALLQKTEHYDKDERYMATSDLCEVIKRYSSSGSSHHQQQQSSYEGYGKVDAATERRICTAVLSLLKDKSNDVQAVAVKTLGVLLTTVQEEQVLEIAESLTDQVLDSSKSELRDVYAIGLRTLCKTVPAPMGDRVSQRLVIRLLEGMSSTDENISLASLDILTDLISRFGATAASLTRQHEPILNKSLQQLNSTSHLIRKRAGNAIGCLSGVLSDTLLVRMVESLLSQIERGADTRALMRTMCTVAGVVGHRLGKTQIDRILPIFLSFCKTDDALTGDDEDDRMIDDEDDQEAMSRQNEVRESCFNGFESFVLKSHVELIQPHLDKIVQAALAYMSYDPNYSYGSDEDEEEDQGDNEDEDDYEDEFEDEDDEDEDDDDSWKVRRASIRALTAVVESQKHNPSLLWNKEYEVRLNKSTTVASALVGRFKEREENCRVDVIDCFTKLLSVTVSASANGVISLAPSTKEDDMDTADGCVVVVIDFRTKYASALVKACEKLLSGRKGGDRSKSSALALLSTLCRAPGGIGGATEINSVFDHVKTFLSGGSSTPGDGLSHHQAAISKSLKLEALSLVRIMLSCNMHDPVCVKNGLHNMLLDDLYLAVKEQWYKVIAEALRVLTEVPKFFVTGYTGSEDPSIKKEEMSSVATTLYKAIEPLLAASDVDQEIKECALSASASLLSSLHSSLTEDQMSSMLSLLLEKLGNETTRIAAIKTLSAIASASDKESMVDDAIKLAPIFGEAISIMASFLKQQSRTLKQNSLEAMNVVITNHGIEDPALSDGVLFSSILSDLAALIADSDLHLSHLGMRVCISTLRVCSACGPAIKTQVLPPALVLSTSSLLQEPALESLLKLLEQMIVSDAVDFTVLFAMLKDKSTAEESLGKHAIANLAKCIGVITAATTVENRHKVLSELLQFLENARSPSDSVEIRQVVLNLLISGNLGRVVDYNSMDSFVDRIKNIYLAYFDSSSEEIKHAAAYALGRAAIGSRSLLLPAIVDKLENSDQKKQYLLLTALREFIQCQLKSNKDCLPESIPVILPHLLNHTSDPEEGARTMVAECLGLLASVKEFPMLQKLQQLVKDHSDIKAEGGHIAADDADSKKNALICWTAVTSVKHAIASKGSVPDLAESMPVFIDLLKQEEVSVRNASLLMIYSSVHHMPQLVSSFLRDIMPTLYEVAGLKLTRIVDLGPFKHTVDDALPMRKSAMSVFATCLEKLPGSMDIAAFMPVLASALGDLEDVQLQAHHIVITVTQKYPTYLVTALDNFIPALETMFMDKTFKRKTNNKTGTELERAKEWIKSGLRALLAMSKLEGPMANRRFSTLVERVKGDAKFRPMLDAIDGL
mmetsp:Transcript_15391/g.23598  ORF Transcript_15391/g.23598 Transcript_15391/m.23598 type:complete len:1350 (+) Transcript_15391:140-4189(+)